MIECGATDVPGEIGNAVSFLRYWINALTIVSPSGVSDVSAYSPTPVVSLVDADPSSGRHHNAMSTLVGFAE